MKQLARRINNEHIDHSVAAHIGTPSQASLYVFRSPLSANSSQFCEVAIFNVTTLL